MLLQSSILYKFIGGRTKTKWRKRNNKLIPSLSNEVMYLNIKY